MCEKAWAPPAAAFVWPSAWRCVVGAAALADPVLADPALADQVLADLAPPPAPIVSLFPAAVLILDDATLAASGHLPLPNHGAVPGRVDHQVVALGAQGSGAPGSSPVLPVLLLP